MAYATVGGVFPSGTVSGVLANDTVVVAKERSSIVNLGTPSIASGVVVATITGPVDAGTAVKFNLALPDGAGGDAGSGSKGLAYNLAYTQSGTGTVSQVITVYGVKANASGATSGTGTLPAAGSTLTGATIWCAGAMTVSFASGLAAGATVTITRGTSVAIVLRPEVSNCWTATCPTQATSVYLKTDLSDSPFVELNLMLNSLGSSVTVAGDAALLLNSSAGTVVANKLATIQATRTVFGWSYCFGVGV